VVLLRSYDLVRYLMLVNYWKAQYAKCGTMRQTEDEIDEQANETM
jgi:hypothetical protein